MLSVLMLCNVASCIGDIFIPVYSGVIIMSREYNILPHPGSQYVVAICMGVEGRRGYVGCIEVFNNICCREYLNSDEGG